MYSLITKTIGFVPQDTSVLNKCFASVNRKFPIEPCSALPKFNLSIIMSTLNISYLNSDPIGEGIGASILDSVGIILDLSRNDNNEVSMGPRQSDPYATIYGLAN